MLQNGSVLAFKLKFNLRHFNLSIDSCMRQWATLENSFRTKVTFHIKQCDGRLNSQLSTHNSQSIKNVKFSAICNVFNRSLVQPHRNCVLWQLIVNNIKWLLMLNIIKCWDICSQFHKVIRKSLKMVGNAFNCANLMEYGDLMQELLRL